MRPLDRIRRSDSEVLRRLEQWSSQELRACKYPILLVTGPVDALIRRAYGPCSRSWPRPQSSRWPRPPYHWRLDVPSFGNIDGRWKPQGPAPGRPNATNSRITDIAIGQRGIRRHQRRCRPPSRSGCPARRRGKRRYLAHKECDRSVSGLEVHERQPQVPVN